MIQYVNKSYLKEHSIEAVKFSLKGMRNQTNLYVDYQEIDTWAEADEQCVGKKSNPV
jgi:hypothetical protein